MYRALLCFLGVLSLAACTSSADSTPAPSAPTTLDPGYLASLEARTKALCDCKPAVDERGCPARVEKNIPLTPPGGLSVDDYEARLDPASREKITKIRADGSRCASMYDMAIRYGRIKPPPAPQAPPTPPPAH